MKNAFAFTLLILTLNARGNQPIASLKDFGIEKNIINQMKQDDADWDFPEHHGQVSVKTLLDGMINFQRTNKLYAKEFFAFAKGNRYFISNSENQTAISNSLLIQMVIRERKEYFIDPTFSAATTFDNPLNGQSLRMVISGTEIKELSFNQVTSVDNEIKFIFYKLPIKN